jgi:hypothetical protein
MQRRRGVEDSILNGDVESEVIIVVESFESKAYSNQSPEVCYLSSVQISSLLVQRIVQPVEVNVPEDTRNAKTSSP